MGICILAIFLTVTGFIPLLFILNHRHRTKTILENGDVTKATIYDVQPTGSGNRATVYYAYSSKDNGREYKGTLTGAAGKFKKGYTFDVYYLPDEPRYHAYGRTWQSWLFIFVGVAIALAMIFASYKLIILYI